MKALRSPRRLCKHGHDWATHAISNGDKMRCGECCRLREQQRRAHNKRPRQGPPAPPVWKRELEAEARRSLARYAWPLRLHWAHSQPGELRNNTHATLLDRPGERVSLTQLKAWQRRGWVERIERRARGQFGVWESWGLTDEGEAVGA